MEPGDLVGGKYRLVRLLGEGGMGTVWAARNDLLGRDVAIKLMLPSITKHPEALRRFFNEAKICASIRDPGIVDVFDLGTSEDGSPFIVMELLTGEPLEAAMERGGLPIDELVRIIRDVAQTLGLAHEKGVVHRDLKPANIFLSQTGKRLTVKILDFGISKVQDADNAYVTRTGAVLGSPAYMSPEQAAGTTVDRTTDLYSLGVVLYEAIGGRIPFFDSPNTNALLVAIATRKPTPLRELAPSVAPSLLTVVETAMRRNPAERYPDSAAMAEALDGVLGELSTGLPALNAVRRMSPSATTASAPSVTAVLKEAGLVSGPPSSVGVRSAPHIDRSTHAPFSSSAHNRKPGVGVIGIAVGIALTLGVVLGGVLWWRQQTVTPGGSGPAASGEPSPSATMVAQANAVAVTTAAVVPVVSASAAPAASSASAAVTAVRPVKPPPSGKPTATAKQPPIKPTGGNPLDQF